MKRKISLQMRYAVLTRDNSTCQKCKGTIKDGKKLNAYIKKEIKRKGIVIGFSFWTLCNECSK